MLMLPFLCQGGGGWGGGSTELISSLAASCVHCVKSCCCSSRFSSDSVGSPSSSVPVHSFFPSLPVCLVSLLQLSLASFRQSCMTILIKLTQPPMFLPVSGRASTLVLRCHHAPCGQPLLTCDLPLSTHWSETLTLGQKFHMEELLASLLLLLSPTCIKSS